MPGAAAAGGAGRGWGPNRAGAGAAPGAAGRGWGGAGSGAGAAAGAPKKVRDMPQLPSGVSFEAASISPATLQVSPNYRARYLCRTDVRNTHVCAGAAVAAVIDAIRDDLVSCRPRLSSCTSREVDRHNLAGEHSKLNFKLRSLGLVHLLRPVSPVHQISYVFTALCQK